jgi:hypothetical protein
LRSVVVKVQFGRLFNSRFFGKVDVPETANRSRLILVRIPNAPFTFVNSDFVTHARINARHPPFVEIHRPDSRNAAGAFWGRKAAKGPAARKTNPEGWLGAWAAGQLIRRMIPARIIAR